RKVEALSAVWCFASFVVKNPLSWPTSNHARPRLVKRRRALLESNPSTNSQPETHPKDERGVGVLGRHLHRSDRLPHAIKTHQENITAKRPPGFAACGRQKFRSRTVYKRRSQQGQPGVWLVLV